MSVKQWIVGGIAAVVAVIGLVMGFQPRTLDRAGTSTVGVQCGSPFAPDGSPSGTDTTQVWADVLGYQNNGRLSDPPHVLAGYCEMFLDDDRAAALLVTGLGIIGLLVVAGRVVMARRRRRFEDEAAWRAQGWMPASEVASPPAGWVWPHALEDDTQPLGTLR
ncbi:hypothetical protein [Blastococcus sp. SYSU D00820]